MANNYYDDEINKHTDWGGDESTGNKPVVGARVQEFIKKSLNGKAGIFHYDTANNRYLVFADAETRDEYLNDTTKTHLLLGNFEAPFNYTASINLISDSYVALLTGSTGNEIKFTFDIVNKQGASTGDGVLCTYTFIKGSTKQTVTARYRAGQTVSFNIDKYISDGTNNVTIGIIGENTLAATTMAVTYHVVNLSLTDETDITRVYNLKTNPESVADIPFTVKGSGTKILEWYLDNELLDFDQYVDEVTTSEATRTKHIPLSNLSQGVHTLQFRAYVVINGERFYSKTLYRQLMIFTGADNEKNIIALSTELPMGSLSNGDVSFYGAQYEELPLKLAVFSPQSHANVEIAILLNDIPQITINATPGEVYSYSLQFVDHGENILSVVVGSETRNYTINVSKSNIALSEITEDLILALSAKGKSNSSTDKLSWRYGDYRTSFSGFTWSKHCGWYGDSLIIPSGASIDINYSPLAENVTSKGKTIELELGTSDVLDDNATVLDLRNSEGVGLLITASEAVMTSAGGAIVSTKYKSEEFLRLSIVINKKSGVTNKCLMFIYVDGVLCGASAYATSDDFSCEKNLKFIGSSSAVIKLKSIRVYDRALSAEEVLNNYALYAPTSERLNIINRNDILNTEGALDYEKIANYLPVMIITGDIPTLEATTDKKTAIIADVDYINNQNPSLSFKAKRMKITPQGTSSMGYPKKNFNLYTQELSDTILYDSNGQVVDSRLYAFKNGAIPVHTWCLKADYAESSSSHNTGIARLWNDALKNMKYDGQFLCRTQAQESAIANNYPYDVRTAIDGFPIAVFYRPDETSDLVFLGKYNFNNDKSTENVFGFRDIPGFNNENMQCWEILNNGHHLALFSDTTNFNTEWSDAFESRYPDTKTPNTTHLKAFCEWVSTVSQADFATSKWEHIDVFKMAAYYVYVTRFGAVDQMVKNAMLTSENGMIFYFIHYDNDTINGLRNDGYLTFSPEITRQSLDDTYTAEVYCYAGHDSKLWNLLEGDSEFMNIVKEVDNALYSAGLSFKNVCEMFDDKQSGQWCERIFNADAQYKYIGPYNEKGTNNLFMLQGNRRSHRRWWLAKRFSIYDSKWVTGEYKSACVELKLAAAPIGIDFSIKAGFPIAYGYGVNNVPIQSGIELSTDSSHTFTTEQVLNIGDPLRIYGAHYLKEVNLSNFAQYLSVVTVANVKSDTVGTKLKKLVLGKAGVENTSVSDISGLQQAEKLEYLDISGFKGITNLSALSSLENLSSLIATGSGLTSIDLEANKLSSLKLPAVQSLSLKNASSLSVAGLQLESWGKLRSISIKNCPALGSNHSFVYDWFESKEVDNKNCSLSIDCVNWTGLTPERLIELGQLATDGGSLKLKGTIQLTDVNPETIEQQLFTIKSQFGENVFDKGAELSISVPDGIFLIGPAEVLDGGEYQFEATVFADEVGTITYSIVSGGDSYRTINSATGLLTCGESLTSDRTMTIRAVHTPPSGTGKISIDKTVVVKARVYPSSPTIDGSARVDNEFETYTWSSKTANVTGEYYVEWSLTGDILEFVKISDTGTHECIISKFGDSADTKEGVLSLKIIKKYNDAVVSTATKTITVLNPDVIMTSISNPEVMALMYKKGLASQASFMTKQEAAAVTETDIQPGTSSSTNIFYNSTIKTFDEFKYFTGLKKIPDYTFYGIKSLTTVTFPNVTEIGNRVLSSAYSNSRISLEKIIIPDSVQVIGSYSLYNANCEIVLSKSLTTIGNNSFYGNTVVSELRIPDSLVSLVGESFSGCTALRYVYIGSGLSSIPSQAFKGSTVDSFTIEVSESNPVLYSAGNCVLNRNHEILWGTSNSIIPGTATKICGGAFRYAGLKKIEVPGNIKIIEDRAFANNGLLETVILHEGVESLNGFTFVDCPSLTSFHLPSSLISTGNPFNVSRKITFHINDLDGFFSRPHGNLLTAGCALYLNGEPVQDVTIPDSVTNLNASWFGPIPLRNVYLNKVQTIRAYAFSGANIETLHFGEDTTDVAESAFPEATFANIIIPETNTTIVADGKALYNTAGTLLHYYSDDIDYTIPSCISKIGTYAFYYSKVESIRSTHLLASIETSAFMNSSLKKLDIYVSTMGEQVFSYSALETAIIQGCTKMGRECFSSCRSLESITLPSTLTSIGYNSFSQCLKLKTLICLATSAPTRSGSTSPSNSLFGYSTSTYTGYDTRSTGENILYVPVGATGYDVGDWLEPLQNLDKCGFTISYSL